jgi:hypothetical protein
MSYSDRMTCRRNGHSVVALTMGAEHVRTCSLHQADDSMEEDTPGLRQSNSAPDLHVMLQQPLQSMPRMLLGPRQQPLGSSSAVGALVPYTATSTKVRRLCCCWPVPVSLISLAGQARVLAANSDGCSALLHDAACLYTAHQPPGVPNLLCPGSGWDAVLRRAWRPLHPPCGCAALWATCLTTAGTAKSNCTLLLPFPSTAWFVG